MVEPKNTGDSQLDKFKRLARDLECDENEKRFEETMKRVAEAPRPKESPPSAD